MIENPQLGDTTLPPALVVNTCFDGLRIKINQTLLETMGDHLMAREDHQARQEDTGFDRWLHGQILETVYNST